MVKTKSEQLTAFIKKNKVARLAFAIKQGYSSWEDYRDFLKDKKVTKSKKSNLTDMVIAFDTTGSMCSYIDAVKKHVKELVPKLFSQNPGLKISIVAFGDYCDMQSVKVFGKAYQVLDLTNNENDIIGFINSTQNTSGGDFDEFYELVIKKITEETSWRKDSNKNVLFIADYEPHEVGYSYSPYVLSNQIDWKIEAKKAAKLKIIFDTLKILPSIKWYDELSQITGGVCLPFTNSQKTADLMEATSLARGGETTVDAFVAMSMSSTVKNDVELDAVYTTYSKSIIN